MSVKTNKKGKENDFMVQQERRKFGQRRLKLISFCQSEKNRHWPLYTKALDTKKKPRMIECSVMINWLATHCFRLQCRLNSEVATKKLRQKTLSRLPRVRESQIGAKNVLSPEVLKNMHINGSFSSKSDSNDDDRGEKYRAAFLAFQQSDFLSLDSSTKGYRADYILCVLCTNDF